MLLLSILDVEVMKNTYKIMINNLKNFMCFGIYFFDKYVKGKI